MILFSYVWGTHLKTATISSGDNENITFCHNYNLFSSAAGCISILLSLNYHFPIH